MAKERHHYIPVCYLANFTEDGKGIWVYNKQKQPPYATSIYDIFKLKNLYKLDESLIPEQYKDILNSKSFEYDFFAHGLENQFSNFLKVLTSTFTDSYLDKISSDNCIADEYFFEHITFQIVIQFFRMPDMRINVAKLLSEVTDKTGLKSPFNNPVIDHMMCLFGDGRLIQKYKELLLNNIIILCVSRSKTFYTSYTPIIRENLPLQDDGFSLDYDKCVLTYPLTKHILVKILDIDYYGSQYGYLNRHLLFVDDLFVTSINKKRIYLSKKEIASSINDFNYTIDNG